MRFGDRGEAERVPFAVDLARELKVVVVEADPARGALQTVRVVFLAPAAGHVVRFHVQALDAAAARRTQRVLEFVVMVRTVRVVLVDVELGRRERGFARPAHKALLVVPPAQPPVGARHRLLRRLDQLVASAANALVGRRRPFAFAA